MSLRNTFASSWESLPVQITAGTSLSPAIDLGGLRLFAVIMPSPWTAANVTFQMSPDGGASWANMKDQNGNELTAVAAAADCIVLDPSTFAAFQHLRVRSGTSANAVNQTATVSLHLLLRTV